MIDFLGFTHSEALDMNKIYSNLLDKDEVRRYIIITFNELIDLILCHFIRDSLY